MASLLLMSVCAILMAAVTKVCTVLLLYSDTIQNSYELFTKTLQVQLLYNARETLSFIMLVILAVSCTVEFSSTGASRFSMY